MTSSKDFWNERHDLNVMPFYLLSIRYILQLLHIKVKSNIISLLIWIIIPINIEQIKL